MQLPKPVNPQRREGSEETGCSVAGHGRQRQLVPMACIWCLCGSSGRMRERPRELPRGVVRGLHTLESRKRANEPSRSRKDTKSSRERDRVVIVDILHRSFQRSPATHKLGILYVCDTLVRNWIGQGGNHAAIQKLSASIPSLMDELLTSAPHEQKVC